MFFKKIFDKTNNKILQQQSNAEIDTTESNLLKKKDENNWWPRKEGKMEIWGILTFNVLEEISAKMKK